MNEKMSEKKPTEVKPDPSRACFLTTATVEAQGLLDNCEPLELARYLRDNKMKSKKELSAVNLYYEIAPEIVARCNKDEWAMFWRDHLRKITALMKLGEYDLAKDLYTFATANLINKKITHFSDVQIVNRVYGYGLNGIGQRWLPYWMRFGILKAALFVGLSYQSVRLGIMKRKFAQVLDI
jgi:hypothetical protein